MTPRRAPSTADGPRTHAARSDLPPLGLAPLGLALLAVPLVLMFACGLATSWVDLHSHQGDVGLYLQKAQALTSGQVPYRDLALEYPPLALVPMVVPYLLWPFGEVTIEGYKWLFAAWEAGLLVVLALVVARVVALGGHGDLPATRAGVRSATLRLWFLCAGAALVLAWRFDLFPALLALVALWAALRGRPTVAGVAIGLGVLAKLFPIAIVPALAVPWLARLDLSRLGRFGGAAAITIVLGLGPFVALAGSNALSFLSYQADRGLQIESVAASWIVLGGLLAGQPPPINHEYASVQVGGPIATTALAALPLVTAVAFGLLAWLGWRRARAEVALRGAVMKRTVVALATVSILVLLLTSKVFSTQYMVWIVPFAALLPRRQFWLAAAAMALTMPIHPLLYVDLVAQEALPILVLNLRNALLLALTAWIIADVADIKGVGDVADVGSRAASPGYEGDLARPAGLEPTTFRSAT